MTTPFITIVSRSAPGGDKDIGRSASNPSQVALTSGSVTAYCFLHSGSDPIRDIYQG